MKTLLVWATLVGVLPSAAAAQVAGGVAVVGLAGANAGLVAVLADVPVFPLYTRLGPSVGVGVQARAGLGAGLAYRGRKQPSGLAEAGASAMLGVELGPGVALRAGVGADVHASPAGVAYGPSVSAGADLRVVRVEGLHAFGDRGFSGVRGVVVLATGGGMGGGMLASALLHRDAHTGRVLVGAGFGMGF